MNNLNKGLVLHYDFSDANTDNNVLRDISAYDHHGTLNGGIDTGKNSIIGEAYDFDGSTGYVQIPSVIDMGQSWTVSVWVNLDVVESGGTSDDQQWVFTLENTANDGNRIDIRNAGDGRWSSQINGDNPLFSSSTANANQWYHLVSSYDVSASTHKFYVDNVLPSSENIGPQLTLENLEGAIANINGNVADRWVDGRMSSLRVYDRAITESEINRIYQQRTSANLQGQQGSGISGAVAQWPLDDSGSTATDVVGGNDGTLQGGVTTGVENPTGRGMGFDGQDDYVEIPDSSGLDGYSELTISAWVNSEDFTQNSRILHKDSSYTFYFFEEELRFYNYKTGTTFQFVHDLNSGEWNHVTLVFTGEESVMFFVDGVKMKELNVSASSVGTSSGKIFIGIDDDISTFLFGGKMSDVRLYDRALSDKEIRDIYDQGLPVPESGMEGHWTLDSVEKPLRPKNKWDLGQQPPNLLDDPENFDPNSSGWSYFSTSHSIVSNVGPNGEDAAQLSFDGSIDGIVSSGNNLGTASVSLGAYVRAASGTFDVRLELNTSNGDIESPFTTVDTSWQWVTFENVDPESNGSGTYSKGIKVISDEAGNLYILHAGLNRGAQFDYSTRSTEVQTIPDVREGRGLQNGSSSTEDSNDLKFRAPRGVVSDGDDKTEPISSSKLGSATWAFRFYLNDPTATNGYLTGNRAQNYFGVWQKTGDSDELWVFVQGDDGSVMVNLEFQNVGAPRYAAVVVTIDFDNGTLRANLDGNVKTSSFDPANLTPKDWPPVSPDGPGQGATHLEQYPVLTKQEAETVRQRLSNDPADPVPPNERWDFSAKTNPHNLFSHSEELGNTNSWQLKRINVNSDQTTAPDGNNTAEELAVDSNPSLPLTRQAPGSRPTGAKITGAFYLKANTLNWAIVRGDYNDGDNNFSQAFQWFDLSNGTIGSSSIRGSFGNHESLTPSMQEVGNGWYRCCVTYEPTSGSYLDFVGVEVAERDDRRIDGTYASQGDSIYGWGAQTVRGEQKMPKYVSTDSSITFPQTVPAQRHSRNDLTLGSSGGSDSNDPDWQAPIGVVSGDSNDKIVTPKRYRGVHSKSLVGSFKLPSSNTNTQFGLGWLEANLGFNGEYIFGAIGKSNNIIVRDDHSNTVDPTDGNWHVFAYSYNHQKETLSAWVDDIKIGQKDVSSITPDKDGRPNLVQNDTGGECGHLEYYSRALTDAEALAAGQRILDNPDSTPEAGSGNSIQYPKAKDRRRGKSDNFVDFPENASASQGKVDGSLKFDGAWIEGGQEIVNQAPSSITASAWVKPDNFNTRSNVLTAYNGSDNGAFQLVVSDGTVASEVGEVWWAVSPGWSSIESNETIPSGEWSLLTLTHDENVGSKVYINGEEVASDGTTGPIDWTEGDGVQNINIGSKPVNGDFFNGEIDDSRVYSRALTQSEVRKLYRNTQTYYKNETGGETDRYPNVIGVGQFPLWTPAELGSDLALWLDAQDEDTLTKSDVDSDGIEETEVWGDKSGNGFDKVQTTEASRAEYRPSGGPSGKATLHFDGVDDFFRTNQDLSASDLDDGGATVFWVHAPVDGAKNILMEWGGLHSSKDGIKIHAPWEDGVLYYDWGGRDEVSAPNGYVDVFNVNGMKTDGSFLRYLFNGEMIYEGSTNPLQDPGNLTPLHIGGGLSQSYMSGPIADIVMVRGPLTDPLTDKTVGYLAHKYDLAGKLPSSHPYKNSPPTV